MSMLTPYFNILIFYNRIQETKINGFIKHSLFTLKADNPRIFYAKVWFYRNLLIMQRTVRKNLYFRKRFLNSSKFFKKKAVKIFMWSTSNYYQLNSSTTFLFLYNPNKRFLNYTEFIFNLIFEVNKVFKVSLATSKKIKWKRSFSFFSYFYIYNEIYNGFEITALRFLKLANLRSQNCYHFIWNFKKNNLLYINLRGITKKKNKNLTFASLGLFIKLFDKRKSMKRGKLIRLLMIKFFRKLFIVANVWKLVLFVKKNPVFLPELLNTFHQPVFLPETEKKKISRVNLKFDAPKFVYLFFLENKSFTFNKLKKKGRIKRKITKKLVLKNKITD